MSVLSKREQRILQMRYYEDRSQVEIAREIGLSQAQVSRLIRRAVDRMRAAVVEESGRGVPSRGDGHPRGRGAPAPAAEHPLRAPAGPHAPVAARRARPRRRARGRLAQHADHRRAGQLGGLARRLGRWPGGRRRRAPRTTARRPSARAGPRSRWPPTSSSSCSPRPWPSCCWSSPWATAGSRRAPPRMGRVAVTPPHRAVERPAGGRALDDRLVREAFEGARAPVFGDVPGRPAPDGRRRGWPTRGSTRSTPTRRRRCATRWEATTIVTTGTAIGQVAVLQPADARGAVHRRQGARAVPLPDQGARPGPGARAARASGCPSSVRPAIYDGDTRARGAPGDPPALEPRAHQPRHAPRRDPAQPPPRGATSSPTSPSSSSTRRTSTAASSARTSPTSCAGCAASPPPTARRRASCSPARRSPTRSSWPSGSPAWTTCALVDRDGSPGARRQIAMWNPPVDRRGAADCARSALGRGGRDGGRARARGRADDLLHQVAQGGRAGRAARRRARSRRGARSSPTASRPTAPATRPSSGASSRRA